MKKAGSRWELNPGYLWLEQPVLCHWPITARQSPTLTILYMYCTGGTKCLTHTHTWQPLSMCHQNSVRGWLENSLHQERTKIHATELYNFSLGYYQRRCDNSKMYPANNYTLAQLHLWANLLQIKITICLLMSLCLVVVKRGMKNTLSLLML